MRIKEILEADQEPVLPLEALEILEEAKKAGLELKVSISKHWMFSRSLNRERILDWWPQTGTICIRKTRYKKKAVRTVRDALELAKTLLHHDLQ